MSVLVGYCTALEAVLTVQYYICCVSQPQFSRQGSDVHDTPIGLIYSAVNKWYETEGLTYIQGLHFRMNGSIQQALPGMPSAI